MSLVKLDSGGWVRTTVRRFPRGRCPECGYRGSLSQRPGFTDSAHPKAWKIRPHGPKDQRCAPPGSDVIVLPDGPLPEGWD